MGNAVLINQDINKYQFFISIDDLLSLFEMVIFGLSVMPVNYSERQNSVLKKLAVTFDFRAS